jgi:hypothetical protein
VRITDPACSFVVEVLDFGSFKELLSFAMAKGKVSSCRRYSTVYCDADISEAHRVTIFTDKIHRCVW